jgi:Zn-dependent peptidase ImmA (M78 family)
MTPDAFSRAINGSRSYSSLELARIAGLAKVDVYWLITGEPDPQRISFAARHEFNPKTRAYEVPGRKDDEQEIDSVALSYRQVEAWLASSSNPVPQDSVSVRMALGPGFVASFAERVEETLDIDVVRIQGLSTDYSFSVAGRRVVLLKSEPNWFHSNWSLAHEIGHFALQHHECISEAPDSPHERQANAFASELLLPEDEVRAVNWEQVTRPILASLVWHFGVSTMALSNRLTSLDIAVSDSVAGALSDVTQRLLRAHPESVSVPAFAGAATHEDLLSFADTDPITSRMRHAAERRFPDSLIRAHIEGIAEGKVGKRSLAWMLEVSPDDLDLDEPVIEAEREGGLSVDDFAAAMGL